MVGYKLHNFTLALDVNSRAFQQATYDTHAAHEQQAVLYFWETNVCKFVKRDPNFTPQTAQSLKKKALPPLHT